LATNDIREKMYCEQRGKIFNFTNNSLQDSLLPTLAIIHITLFCNLKIGVLRGELPQKINPYVIIE
jgi:preprotein translocase subunit SecF